MPLGLPHSRFLAWSQLDQDKALMYVRENARVCDRCRTRKVEWDDDPDAYIGDISRCEGCGRLDDEAKNLEDMDSRGARIGLVPRVVAEARLEAEQAAEQDAVP